MGFSVSTAKHRGNQLFRVRACFLDAGRKRQAHQTTRPVAKTHLSNKLNN